jgi:tetratricopeptide (TPR) repeat protein
LREEGPQRLSNALATRLSNWSDLPPMAKGAVGKIRVRDAASERAALKALDAVESGEPEFAAFTTVIRYERVEHMRFLSFLYEKMLELPQVERETNLRELPFLVDHPDYDIFARVLEAPNGPPRPPDSRGFSEENLYGLAAFEVATHLRLDDTEDDLRGYLPRLKPDAGKAYVARCLRVSLHSSHWRVHAILNDRESAKRDATDWEKEFASHPAVLAALGRKYHDLEKYDDAERTYLAAVKFSPDNLTYLRLAGIYGTVRKDEAKMLAAMEERLTRPDYALEHSAMRVRIAEVYANRKDFNTALKYAEKAAEDSGAPWSIRATISYATRLGDKEKAILWERRLRERYKLLPE